MKGRVATAVTIGRNSYNHEDIEDIYGGRHRRRVSPTFRLPSKARSYYQSAGKTPLYWAGEDIPPGHRRCVEATSIIVVAKAEKKFENNILAHLAVIQERPKNDEEVGRTGDL